MGVAFADLLPVATVLVGVLVGAFASELRTLLQGARNRRSAYRILLYQLLELRFQARRRDPSQFVRRLRELDDLQGVPGSREVALKIFRAAEHMLNSERPLSDQYEQAVSDIAPHDPIVAYQLRSRSELLTIDQSIRLYYSRATELLGAHDPNEAEFLSHMESASLDMVRKEALVELDAHIRRIARRIDPFTYFRAMRVLKRQEARFDESFCSVLEEFQDEVTNRIMEGKAV